MKIDESVIAKVLDNKASPEEARKVAGWFATEEGNKYLSERFDWEIGMLSEEMPESIDPHSIPSDFEVYVCRFQMRDETGGSEDRTSTLWSPDEQDRT